MASVITIQTREAALRRKVRKHLKSLGFTKDANGQLVPPDTTKDTYRRMHDAQRREKLAKYETLIQEHGERLLQNFASGNEVNPHRISPRLVPVAAGSEEALLFRFASLYWRIPVSDGYGRRLRFLVVDDTNSRLIGLIGLTDPVFNLGARDNLIGWNHKDRVKRLVHMMDAFVLGALPPYSHLLGGKMVACLVRSKEVVEEFRAKYGSTRGIISGKKKDARLVAITTSSALGRSSIYNRLKLGGVPYFQSIGYTQGWGHFHFPDDLFSDLRSYLSEKRDKYYKNNRFGQGPNWRMRAIRQALDRLDLGAQIVHHGLKREVFFCPVADHAAEILKGDRKRVMYSSVLTVAEIGELARNRWLEPRAHRQPEYMEWRREEVLKSILQDGNLAVGRAAVYGKRAK